MGKVDIIPQRVNANRHTQRGMGELERSIEQDGWIGAITVAADGETFDGSARLEKLATAGLREPLIVDVDGSQPVVVRRTDILTADDPRAKRLAVAANKIAADNLDWDASVLAALSEEMDLSGLFRDDELAALLAAPVDIGGAGDAGEEPNFDAPTECQLGDVWQVGRHIVACMDSTEPGNLDRVLAGKRPQMVWADPPYAISAVDEETGQTGGLGRPGGGYPFGGAKNDGKSKPIKSRVYAPVIGDDSAKTAMSAAGLCLEMFPAALHIWWGANHYSHIFPPSPCWIVWDKENGTNAFADCELAWTNDTGAVRMFRHMWNGMLRASEHGERAHPTQKPIALCEWAFAKYGSAGDLILDPFLGSGPSLKAAERSGRTVVGCELSPHYCDHIIAWGRAAGLSVARRDT